MKARVIRSVIVATMLFACADTETLAGPEMLESREATLDVQPGGPTGIAGFYFLLPIATADLHPRDRDNSLLDLLAVDICEWNGTTCVLPLVRHITSAAGSTAQLEELGGTYRTQWNTHEDALDPTKNYRIRVLAAGGEIGHVDVDVAAPGESPSPGTVDFVRLVPGTTLPIAFVIRKGAGARVGSEGGTVEPVAGVTVTIPPGALTQDVFLTAVPATNLPAGNLPVVPGTGWDFGPDGLVFAHPVVLTIPYDPAAIPPGVPESELRIHKLVNGAYEQQNAGLVDLVNHTVSADVDGFSVFVIMQRDPLSPEDVAPPVITAFDVRNSPTVAFSGATTLNVSTADATLFTRIRLTDNGSGVNWIDLRWLSPSGRQMRFPCYRGGAPDAGSDTNGEWLCTTIFPQHSEGGLWKAAIVWIRDNVQNQALYSPHATGFCTNDPTNCLTSIPAITVNSATPDISPPVLQSLGVSLDVQPRMFTSTVSVDASTGPRRVWFGFQATDDLSGIGGFQPFDFFHLWFTGPSNQTVEFGFCAATQGTILNGTWECFVDVPAQAETGTWRLSRLRVPDRVGNGGFSFFADFLPNGNQLCRGLNCVPSPTVQVTSLGDAAPPDLQTVNIQSSLGVVTTTLGINDNVSGVSFVRVYYQSASTTQFQECFASRTGGTTTSGTWACTITFPSAAARGQWFLSVQVIDVAGNSRWYTRRSDGQLCYVVVGTGSVCQDFGVTDLLLLDA